MNKIVILDGYSLNPGDLSWEKIESLGTTTLYDRTSEDMILERIKGANIIITNKTPLKKDVLEKCPEIEYIGVLATGYNVVDIEYCKKSNIVVTNIPTYGTEAVSQHVFALILELTNHVAEHSMKAKEGKWSKSKDFCFWDKPLVSLNDKTIGIVGAGKIGLRTAQIAQAFGMKVLATNSKRTKKVVSETFSYASLDTLLENSDIISLHCPLTQETEKIINERSISRMKKGVILINTSRGQLIDEQDLFIALENGSIGGCGLDVLSEEPPKDNVLISARNIIITPHIAWAAKEARVKLMEIAYSNLRKYLASETENNVCN